MIAIFEERTSRIGVAVVYYDLLADVLKTLLSSFKIVSQNSDPGPSTYFKLLLGYLHKSG